MLKKSVLISFWCLVLTGAFLFINQSAPVTRSIGWILNRVADRTLNSSLTYSDLQWTERGLSLINTHLKEAKLNNGTRLGIFAKRLDISLGFHLFPFRVDLELAPEQLQIQYLGNDPTWREKKRKAGPKFEMRCAIQIDNGTLFLTEGQPLPFKGRAHYEYLHWTVEAALSSAEGPSPLQVSLTPDGVGQLKCQNLELAPLVAPFLHEGISLSGRVNGLVEMHREVELPYAEGQLDFSALEVAHSRLEFKGKCQEASLQFSPPVSSQPVMSSGALPKPTLWSSLAFQFALKTPGNFRFTSAKKEDIILSGLQGKIVSDAEQDLSCRFRGILQKGDTLSPVIMKAQSHWGNIKNPFVDVCITASEAPTGGPAPSGDTQFRVIARETGGGKKEVDLDLDGVGRIDFSILQGLTSFAVPELSRYRMLDGKLSTKLKALFNKKTLEKLHVSHLHARDLLMEAPHLALAWGWNQFTGSLDWEPNRGIESLNCILDIDKGFLHLTKSDKTLGKLDEITAKVGIVDGLLGQSEIQASFARLKGTAQLKWPAVDELAKLQFSGKARDLIELFPQPIAERLALRFKEDEAHIIASIVPYSHGLQVISEVEIRSQYGEPSIYSLTNPSPISSSQRQVFSIGFDLEWVVEKLLTGSEPVTPDYHKLIGLGLPVTARPALILRNWWHEREQGLRGLLVRNGWFYAKSLPLSKYVEPFIDKDGQLSLTGSADVLGEFDHRGAMLRYLGRKVHLENPYFRIDVDHMGSSPAFTTYGYDQDSSEEELGVHQFDFQSRKHFGTIRIRNGQYLEKNTGLLFDSIATDVFFIDKKIHLADFATRCEGIEMFGDLEVDFSPHGSGNFTLDIVSSALKGNVSNLKSFLKAFSDAPFSSIPIEGKLFSSEGQGHFSINGAQRPLQISCEIEGKLTDGELSTTHNVFDLENLRTQFHYSFEKNQLTFDNMEAEARLAPFRQKLNLIAHQAKFEDLINQELDFDIGCQLADDELIRLKGRTQLREDRSILDINLDPDRSHFFNTALTNPHVALKHWSQFAEVDFFGTIPCQRLGVASLKGTTTLSLKRDEVTQPIHYTISSNNLSMKGVPLPPIKAGGILQDSISSISSFRFGGAEGKFDLSLDKGLWHLKKGAMTLRDEFTCSFDGSLAVERQQADLNIKIDFALLSTIKRLCRGQIPEFSWPEGSMGGDGTLHLDFSRMGSSPHFTLELSATMSDVTIPPYLIEFEEAVYVRFDSDRGLSVDGVKTRLERAGTSIFVDLDSIDFDLLNHRNTLEGIHFILPMEESDHLLLAMRQYFDTKQLKSFLDEVEAEEKLEGVLNLELDGDYYSIEVNLKEGEYAYRDVRAHLTNPTFTVSSDKTSAAFSLDIADQKIYTYGETTSNWKTPLKKGVMAISPLPFNEEPTEETAVMARWKRDDSGITVDLLKGSFGGIIVDFKEGPGEARENSTLEGDIFINRREAAQFLPKPFAKMQVGKGYGLSGTLTLPKLGPKDFRFQGRVFGKNYELLGYIGRTLTGKVIATTAEVILKDIALEDPAGQLKAEHAAAHYTSAKGWHLYTPSIVINEFRPGLLKKVANEQPPSSKSFLISEFQLQNLQGFVSDLGSFSGLGEFSFTTTTKKSPSFLSIPADLIARIGLDFDALSPSQGTIHYEIRDEKVILTKLEDVFSEGRISRFYLPSGAPPSYIDFGGNLNIKVKMKQYNLLFKLAELLTVTVHGHWKKPQFSLGKRKGRGRHANGR